VNTYGVQSVPADTTPKILHLLEDRNAEVREAAVMCLETMYIQIGPSFMVNNQSAFIFLRVSDSLSTTPERSAKQKHSRRPVENAFRAI
jgi:hypothetical protein